MSTPLLKISHLSVEFGPQSHPIRVVDDVSFAVESGGAVGVVGESGSGKSVTSLSIMRLIPTPPGRIAQGTIELNGTDVLKLPMARMPEIRGRDIAMIFQEPMSSLNPVMRIGDQIDEAIMLHDKASSAERRRRVVETLSLVGIPDPEGRLGAYPHQFSGGMRQRVMIAMAIICKPKLLIADEPTTALDVTIQAQVLDLMKRVRRELGTAILLISHDLGVIADVCDSVVVMYAGKILEIGDVRSIFRRPRHPYTQGLLRSIPRLQDDNRRLFQIPGTIPSAGSVQAGCPFYLRCSVRIDKCRAEMPPMFAFGAGNQAACWVAADRGAEAVS
jgi:oligopeptide/dipeptide ABC transporter ATP-binding protein